MTRPPTTREMLVEIVTRSDKRYVRISIDGVSLIHLTRDQAIALCDTIFRAASTLERAQ